VLSRAKLITPEILLFAFKALAAQAPELKDPDAGLLPDVMNLWEISVQITAAVINQAVRDGAAQEKAIPDKEQVLEEWIKEKIWDAQYRPLKNIAKAGASRAALGERAAGVP